MFEKQVNPIPHELVSKFRFSLDILQSAFLERPVSMCSFNDYETLYFLIGADLIIDDETNETYTRIYRNLVDQ